jgi:ketosteroid isomerase-like protein
MTEALETLIAEWESFPFGDLDGEQATQAFVELIGPHASEDFVCVMSAGGLRGEFPGIEGLEQAWRDFFAGFETIRFTQEGLQRGLDGKTLIEFVHLSGRPNGARALVEQDGAAVYRLRESELTRIEFYLDRAEALEATRQAGGSR